MKRLVAMIALLATQPAAAETPQQILDALLSTSFVEMYLKLRW